MMAGGQNGEGAAGLINCALYMVNRSDEFACHPTASGSPSDPRSNVSFEAEWECRASSRGRLVRISSCEIIGVARPDSPPCRPCIQAKESLRFVGGDYLACQHDAGDAASTLSGLGRRRASSPSSPRSRLRKQASLARSARPLCGTRDAPPAPRGCPTRRRAATSSVASRASAGPGR